MESGIPAFDFSDKEVYVPSCDVHIPFKNPSDAAIARLSIQRGVSLRAVQAVLDLIVFNPSFNSREVTFKSASRIDKVAAEYREVQVSRRLSGGSKEMVSSNVATSPLAISLVVSQIEQDMDTFLQAIKLTLPDRDFKVLLKTMSLVHRSWTMSAQELLFRRMIGSHRSQNIRSLLQHPFCSRIRELHMVVRFMSGDDLDRFALLLRRLPSLRRLSLDVSDVDRFTWKDPDDICSKIYSEIAPCLSNLAELRIQHNEFWLLERCAKCILQRGSGAAPFILKNFSTSGGANDDEFESEMLLSPPQLHPIVHHETPHFSSTYQVPNSRNIVERSITVKCQDDYQLQYLFDTGGVLRNILPEISHFSLYLWYGNTLDVIAFGALLARFLGECYSLAHMHMRVFFADFFRQEITSIPLSSIPGPLQVLSIYYSSPVYADEQKRASRLERFVQTIHDREAGSSLELVEVMFCRDLEAVFRQAFENESGDLQHEGVEMALPEYLDPVHRMCQELNIDIVCKTVE